MSSTNAWLMLISSVSGQNQTARMRVWRALKACGAGALRDGVYVLPYSKSARAAFEQQASDVIAAGGSAHIVSFHDEDAEQRAALISLFDRAEDYARLLPRLDALRDELAGLDEIEARRRMAGAQRDVAALAAIDFFPGPAQQQTLAALADSEAALNACFAPDEPHAAPGKIARRDPKDYQGRTWATRRRLWIDRCACAWLIRRFIDRRARFKWLRHVKDCPKRALGFDFDGAEFSHVGGKVTFEVLVAAFGLQADRALVRLGALVHYLDVGGIAVPEAAGFAAIMAGARAIASDDDALLKAIAPVLDSLHASYSVAADT